MNAGAAVHENGGEAKGKFFFWFHDAFCHCHDVTFGKNSSRQTLGVVLVAVAREPKARNWRLLVEKDFGCKEHGFEAGKSTCLCV